MMTLTTGKDPLPTMRYQRQKNGVKLVKLIRLAEFKWLRSFKHSRAFTPHGKAGKRHRNCPGGATLGVALDGPPALPGIITERQAFSGFASPGVAAYAALFVLSEAFAEVKVLDALMWPGDVGDGGMRWERSVELDG